MTKEEFLALNIQPNDVVLVNDHIVGFAYNYTVVRPILGTRKFKEDHYLLIGTSTLKTCGLKPYSIEYSSVESIKVIGRVENA